MHSTPPSLLDQVRQTGNHAAWRRFVDLYTPLLNHWAGKLGLQSSDAENLVQEVMLTLVVELPTFRYQPGKRFRGWLWTVTVNKHRSRLRARAAVPGNHALGEVADSFSDQELFEEEEYRRYLINRAMRLMQSDFEPATWKACWDFVVEGRPAGEIAIQLGITVNAVYLAKVRVLRRLRQELEGLLE